MRIFTLFIIWLFFATGLLGQEIPPVQNYGIDDYGAGSQNWSITQSDDRHVYIGNNNGLLEFNGSFWNFYPSPNGTIIRAVHEKDGLIYSGCYMEFGYWKRNNRGQLDYFSISDKLTVPLIDDEHFWNITSRDEWILFQSLNRIYLYNTGDESFEVLDLKIPRAKIFNLKNKIYIQKEIGGLYSIQNGRAILESDHAIFSNNVVVGIFEQEGQLLILTEKGNFYFLDQGESKVWETDDLKLGADSIIYCSLKLQDGSFVLGTVSDGYIKLKANGKIDHRINQEDGLANNTVLSIFEDMDSNLWLGLDNGISVINLDSPFSVYEDRRGEIGSVYATLVHKDLFYLGTNQGLYAKNIKLDQDFELVNGTAGQVWSLNIIEGTIFCGHTNGTFVVKGKKAEHIYKESGTWEVKEFDRSKNILIQGHYNGLSTLYKENGQWSYGEHIAGFDISSKSFVVVNDQKLVVNHEFKGLLILDLNLASDTVVDIAAIGRNGYDTQVFQYLNKIWYDSNEGVYQLDLDQALLVKDTLFTNLFYEEGDKTYGRILKEKNQDRLWGFSPHNIIYVAPDHFDGTLEKNKIPISRFFRQNQGLTGYENISKSTNNGYIIGTSNGYTVFDLDQVANKVYPVRINAVEQKFQNSENEFLPLNQKNSFNYEESSLIAHMSVPSYSKYTEVVYRYRIKGLYNDWSKWFGDPYVSIENLPFGSYTLDVQGRVGNELTSNVASFSFVVDKPWYLTNVAVILYVLFGTLVMIVINRLFSRYYKNQRNRLVARNKKELELSKLESEQEIILLRNEQLKTELDSKNRELATTAMSLINKNELLLGIKKDLLLLEGEVSKEDVVNLIDSNLSNNNDWDFFKEAFNNADKDFLNKIKILHPELTANDLKFCAYLRLNLSSKEIAPLLHISVRSVEIKRYRLRKKLNLNHSENLVDYILEI